MNLLEKIDLLGEKFEFKYRKQSTYKTKVGGCLTILVAAAVTFTTWFFTSNLLDTTKPEVSSSMFISEIGPRRDLYNNSHAVGIAIYVEPNKMVKAEEIHKYITPLAFVYEMNSEAIHSGTLTFSSVEVAPFVPCRSLEDKSFIKDFMSDVRLSKEGTMKDFSELYLLCPQVAKKDEYYLLSNTLAPPFRMVQYKMFPCTLADSDECVSSLTLAYTNINLAMVQTSFSPENKKKPLKRVPFLKSFKIGIKQTINHEISLKGNEIIDDEFSFFPRKKRFEFIDKDEESMYAVDRPLPATHCTPEQIQRYQCLPYSVLGFTSSGKTQTIIRNYPKFVETLGEIGGTAELVVTLSFVLYCWYNSHHKNRFNRHVCMDNQDEWKSLQKLDSQKKEEIDRVGDSLASRREDIMRLHDNQTKWEMFQKILFRDYHHTLFPLVAYYDEQKRLKMKESALKARMESEQLQDTRRAGSLESGIRRRFSFARSTSRRRLERGNFQQNVSAIAEAFRRLKASSPQNEMQKAIKEYFLQSLPHSLKDELSLRGQQRAGVSSGRVVLTTEQDLIEEGDSREKIDKVGKGFRKSPEKSALFKSRRSIKAGKTGRRSRLNFSGLRGMSPIKKMKRFAQGQSGRTGVMERPRPRRSLAITQGSDIN